MTIIHLIKDLESMSKLELMEVLDYLKRKVDSGSYEHRESQILKDATKIFIRKYEPEMYRDIYLAGG